MIIGAIIGASICAIIYENPYYEKYLDLLIDFKKN
jgi:hypothetical protein